MFKIESKHETELSKQEREELLTILNNSFDGVFGSQIFFKQIPHLRYFVKGNDKIIAHVGIDYRGMNLGGKIIFVVGIIDLCVVPNHRRKGWGSELIKHIENTYKEKADFLLLFADDHRVYLKNGFTLANNQVSWLGIDKGKTLGIISKNLDDCLMYKPLNKDALWSIDSLDMMGYLY